MKETFVAKGKYWVTEQGALSCKRESYFVKNHGSEVKVEI